jgi:ribulose-5-phosphate 4-epimerase/fuculose-1-phosphate aldolase
MATAGAFGTGLDASSWAQSLAVQKKVSEAEWRIRVDLAAAYRLVAHYGWDDLIFTHLSARVPGDAHHFLLNPMGVLFNQVTASSLVKVDQNGEIVDESPFSVNPAGFTIHSAVHMARHEVGCVMHLHTTAGMAVSAQERGLLPLTQTAMLVANRLAYHEYEGVALDHSERERLIQDLGDKDMMILRNHGTLTMGNTVPEAFVLMHFLERACQAQVMAQAGGASLHWPTAAAIETTRLQSEAGLAMTGHLAWPGLLAMLDRLDASYAT